MKTAITDKKVLMKKSINRACARERFVGFVYFLGTLALAVLLHLRMLVDLWKL